MAKKRERKGGLRIDPGVQEWLREAARNPAAMTAKQRWDSRRQRASYDLTTHIQEAVKAVARKEDTSASQVVEMLLAFAMVAYARGDEELRGAFWGSKTPARTPRFSWNLEVPEGWKERIAELIVELNREEAGERT